MRSSSESKVRIEVVVTKEEPRKERPTYQGMDLVQQTYFTYNGFWDKRAARKDAERWARFSEGELLHLVDLGNRYRAYLYKKREN